MSVEHLDLLHEKLPELFAVKQLPENWDDDLIIVSVPDVELINRLERYIKSRSTRRLKAPAIGRTKSGIYAK